MPTAKIKLDQSILLNNRIVNNYLVIGTMSSGKSTFVNSLLGFELFPSKNMACTAKAFSYYGNTEIDYFIYINNLMEKPRKCKKIVSSQIEEWNNDRRIAEIKIEGPIMTSKEKSFAIIDTPGPNNSMDKTHKEIMERTFEKTNFKSIIYLLNATQLGVEDDKNLINLVKENTDLNNIIFVVNKADMIDDTQQENLSILSGNVMKYLSLNGFKEPTVYFVSAVAAALSTKVQSNIPLTRREAVTYWRLKETMRKNLADYNININISNLTVKQSIKSNNEIWNNSGIQSIINLL